MPYRRTYKKKKSYRRRGAARGKIYGAAAGQLWKDVKMLKSMINVEYKVNEASTIAGSAGNTPNVLTLTNLIQGTDYNQRNGRSVKWTSIYSRLNFVAAAGAVAPSTVRCILFWCKDPSGVAPTPLQMFGSATPNINAMMNLNVRKDFNIVKDFIVTISPVTGAGTPLVFRKLFKKVSQHTIYNAGNTGTIADQESYSLHWFIWGSNTLAGNWPVFDVTTRLRYIDN